MAERKVFALTARALDASATITIPVRMLLKGRTPLEDYKPQPGDVWVLGVARESGVAAVAPDGWTLAQSFVRIPWSSPDGHADVSAWHRMISPGEDPLTVTIVLARSAWAEAELRAYRSDDREGSQRG